MSERRPARQDSAAITADATAEKSLVGICLKDTAAFWKAHGKVQPEHFSVPRLGLVWKAMLRCAETGKPISRNAVPLHMPASDAKADVALGLYLPMLTNDAPTSDEVDAYIEIVTFLANKRALLESLDRARNDILQAEVGLPSEEMKDIGITHLSRAFGADSDDDMRTYGDWAHRVWKRAADAYEKGEGAHVGLSTGLSATDTVMGRLLPGKLYVLAGMASSGKSALVRQIAEGAALDRPKGSNAYGLIESLEMTGDEYATRAIAQQLGIEANSLEYGQGGPGTIEQMYVSWETHLRHLPIYVDQRPRQNLDGIRARALKIKNTTGILFLVIDHLLLIRATSKTMSIADRVADATITGKELAKELGIPVLMLAQLDEKRILESPSGWPNASHLFGGQTINQNADAVIFVHRPVIVERKREPRKSDAEKHAKWVERMDQLEHKAFIWNDKRRGAQAGGFKTQREMLFDGPTMVFSDI